jgi:hypothetical protein
MPWYAEKPGELKMPKGKRLVTQHLENISWKVLEEYQNVVRDMIRRRAGGWNFWYYKNQDGEWVRLQELKG